MVKIQLKTSTAQEWKLTKWDQNDLKKYLNEKKWKEKNLAEKAKSLRSLSSPKGKEKCNF
jgi:hypothetical protein